MSNAGIMDTGLRFDLFNLPADYYDDPYPYLRALRQHDPVHPNADGSMLLTRYRDVQTVWRDNNGSVEKRAQFQRRFGEGPLLEHHTSTMLFRDEPDHSRLRRIIDPLLRSTAVKRRQSMIEALVDRLIDAALARERLDFVNDFALHIPMTVICDLLGVRVEDGPYLHEIGARILFPLNPNVPTETIAAGHDAVVAFRAYLQPYFEAARARATPDDPSSAIEALVKAQAEGHISDEEMVHMCIILLNGGHETTTNLLAGSLNALIDRPDVVARIRTGADMKGVVEEMIRFISPLQLQGRRTTRPVMLPSGSEIPSETEVVLCQASANRDETVFDHPDD
ncbi:MAG: cytochrome P450, partial [Steroidobacteraceae bacterium]